MRVFQNLFLYISKAQLLVRGSFILLLFSMIRHLRRDSRALILLIYRTVYLTLVYIIFPGEIKIIIFMASALNGSSAQSCYGEYLRRSFMCPKMLVNGFIKFPDIINYCGACQQVLGLIISLKAITKFIVIGIISSMNMEIVTFPHANVGNMLNKMILY